MMKKIFQVSSLMILMAALSALIFSSDNAIGASRQLAVVPTGTGFFHVTSGVGDTAARAVALGSSDVTGTLPTANGGTGGLLPVANGGTGLSALGADGTVLRSNGTAFASAYYAPPDVDGLRLTLTSGTPVPTADVALSTTIYLTPFRSGWISIYDGVGGWVLRSTAEISIPIGTLLNNTNYDVFVYYSGSVSALISSAWASNTTRTDALVRQDGVLVKSGAPGQRYVGTFRTASTTQTTDTITQRFLYNEYNQVRRGLSVVDATATWTYALAAFRQVRATTSNRVDVLVGQPTQIEVLANNLATAGASGIRPICGIGIDSTTTSVAISFGTASSASFASETDYAQCAYDGTLSVGYHAVNWLEAVGTAASVTMYGTSGGAVSGMRVRMLQ